MKKSINTNILGILAIVFFFILIILIGFISPEEDSIEIIIDDDNTTIIEDEEEIEDLDKDEEDEEEQSSAVKQIHENIYSLFKYDEYGIITDAKKELLDSNGYINDEYYNIEELKDKKFKGYVEFGVSDVGTSDLLFLADDGTLYKFSSMCIMVDYNNDDTINDCVSKFPYTFKVDQIKSYTTYSLEIASMKILFYVGNNIYDIEENKVDLTRYPVFNISCTEGKSLVGYNTKEIIYDNNALKDNETNKDILFDYIIVTYSDNKVDNYFSTWDMYIVSSDKILYSIESIGSYTKENDFKINRIAKIDNIDYTNTNKKLSIELKLDNGNTILFE